jgi:predicted dehydrogenase
MGREFASASARWCHLTDLDVRPIITAACDVDAEATTWFEDHVPELRYTTSDYQELLEDEELDAIYCAVPHNLHEEVYVDIISAGKHLLGEKPFGIDLDANRAINRAIEEHPEVLVRCSSEFPFFPAAYQMMEWIDEGRFGDIIEVQAGFWHSSDLNPEKPINWKRMEDINGEYGCMGDLGLHAFHIPLRFGWTPVTLSATLSNIMETRPDGDGNRVPCETWDNAELQMEVDAGDRDFPMTISTKRIAPGHANTWFLSVYGTEFSAEFSTKNPKELRYLSYAPGDRQAWCTEDWPHVSAYEDITGGIFEFGFTDAIQQMWAAFCDELAHGTSGMHQPFHCATPEEARQTHEIFTAALQSQEHTETVSLDVDRTG